MDLGKLTALQLAEKIKQHQISVLDGAKYVFDQIEAKEDKVHAYLDTYKKEAYARAKKVQKGIETELTPDLLQVYLLQLKIISASREKQLPVHQRSLRILCRSTMPRLLTAWNRQVL